MISPTSIDYDVINRGAYRINAVIRNSVPVARFGQRVLFGATARSTSDDFMTYNYAKHGVVLPQEVLRGADPNRRNYGQSFDENHIASAYFFDEFAFNIQNAEHRVEGETDLTRPWSVEQRLMYLVAASGQEWELGLDAKIEELVWDIIFTGKFSVRNGGEQAFPVDDSLLGISGANLATDPAKTLSDACLKLLGKGARITEIIFNPEDWARLLSKEPFYQMLDNRRFFGSTVESEAVDEDGYAVVGFINIPGIGTTKCATYAGLDTEGNYHLPKGSAVLHNGPIGFIGNCGVYVNLGNVQGKEGIKRYTFLYPHARGALVDSMVQHQSAPCPVLTAIDRYGVMTSIPQA